MTRVLEIAVCKEKSAPVARVQIGVDVQGLSLLAEIAISPEAWLRACTDALLPEPERSTAPEFPAAALALLQAEMRLWLEPGLAAARQSLLQALADHRRRQFEDLRAGDAQS